MTTQPLTSTAAPLRRRTSWRARIGLWRWRHGAWLPAALLLLAAAAGLAWHTAQVAEQAQRLVAPEPAVGRSSPTAAAPAAPQGDGERLAAFLALLPPAAEATPQVRRLIELTRPQLAWQRAEFQHSEDTAAGVLRLQITVPVAGEYAAMRMALESSLQALPHLSLEQVQLRRAQPDDTRLEARLRFSLFLAVR